MYTFVAHFFDTKTDEEILRTIRFDGQFFDTEKDAYLYAMGKAYDMKQDGENLDILELYSC